MIDIDIFRTKKMSSKETAVLLKKRHVSFAAMAHLAVG